jgi:hypothetical protein
MSGVSATNARIAGPATSIRPDRVSPPCARGATEPVSSQSRRHFTPEFDTSGPDFRVPGSLAFGQSIT